MSAEAALELLLAHCQPAAACVMDACLGTGSFISGDVSAPSSQPPYDVAALDGFAAASVDLIGATAFNPACLMSEPVFVSIGERMPAGCDCVVDPFCVGTDGPPFTIGVSAAPGEGVRRMGDDVDAGAVLLRSGSHLSTFRAALLQIAGARQVSVRRPRVGVVGVTSVDGRLQTFDLVLALLMRAGVIPESTKCASRSASDVLQSCSGIGEPDLLMTIGGSGAGLADHSIDALRLAGAQMFHGLALSGGSSIAVGVLNGRPVIALPGQFDGALAGWLTLVQPVLQRLCGLPLPGPMESGPLLRKISSLPGVTDVVLMERTADGWAPSPAGKMSVAHALRANGYLLIGAGSEGLAAGAIVRPYSFPGDVEAHS